MKHRAIRVFAVFVAVYAAAVLVFLVAHGFEVGFTANDIYFVPVVTGTAVGVFLSFKLPDNRMGLLMTVMSATLVTLGVSNVIIERALEDGNDLLAVVVVQLSDLAWVTQFLSALVLLPLWFPTGRPINRRWAWVGRIAIGSALVAELSFIFAETACAFDSTDSDVCIEIVNPWGIAGMVELESLLLLAMAMAFPAVASAFVRWRRADDVERHQIKWFFVAAAGLLVAFMISFADLNQTLNEIVFATGLTGIWVAIAIAVLKLRLYEIDRILSRTVSYAVVIVLLGAVYVGLVTAIGSQFEGSLAVAASTLAVAALFTPLRRRVQAWVDRRFNRSTYDTAQVMDEFAGSLRDEVDTGEVIEGWVGVVEETMQPSAVGVWVREER
jgi:hypothetical protein